MTCNEALTSQEIDDLNTNVRATNDWAEGGPADSAVMANGRIVASPSKVIADAQLFKAPTAYSAAVTYTDATEPVTESGVVFAPILTFLPIGPETFDSAKWYVLQGFTRGNISTITNVDYDTIIDMTADTGTLVGDSISVQDYASGNKSGVLHFNAVTGAASTPDGGSQIDHDTLLIHFVQNFPQSINVDMFGAGGGAANDSVAINFAFAYTATLDAKVLNLSRKKYDITLPIGRPTGGGGGTIDILYGNGAIVEYTGIATGIDFIDDAPDIYDLRVFRATVGANLFADLGPGGTFQNTVGIAAPKIRNKNWSNMSVEGFAFGVDQQIDSAIDSSYLTSRCIFTNIDTSGCLTGWNVFVAGTGSPFHTACTWTLMRYAGDSVKDGATKTGRMFRGGNDGNPTPDQFPSAMTFITPICEQALDAINIDSNGKGNTIYSPFFEDNDNNVFFVDNPGNPNSQWTVFGDQDASANILTNPDFTTQQHTLINTGRDIRIQSKRFSIINNVVGMGKDVVDFTTVGSTFNVLTGLLRIVASASAQFLGVTFAGAGAIQEFYRNATVLGDIRVDANDNLQLRAIAGDLHISTLPTSTTGLASGTLWNNGGTPAIVP